MTKKQKNRHYMFENVYAVLQKFQEDWKDLPEFVEIVGEMESFRQKSEGLIKNRQELAKPWTNFKKEALEEFSIKTGQLAGLVQRLALKAGDTEVSIHTDFSIKSTQRESAQNVLSKVQRLLDAADNYKEELGAMVMGGSLLKDTIEIYEDFKTKVLLPSRRRTLSRDLNERLEKLQNEAVLFLNKHLDMVMRYFIDIKPEFYAEFESSRKVPQFSPSRRKSSTNQGDSNEGDLIEEEQSEEDVQTIIDEESDSSTESPVESSNQNTAANAGENSNVLPSGDLEESSAIENTELAENSIDSSTDESEQQDDPAENQESDANIVNEDSNSEKQNKAGPPESKEPDSGIDSQENKDDQEEGNAA